MIALSETTDVRCWRGTIEETSAIREGWAKLVTTPWIKTKPSKTKVSKDLNITDLELSISNKIGLNVEIKNKKNNKGKITFEYKDLNQLNKIIEIIKSNY